MSDIKITPELLRAVGDWVRSRTAKETFAYLDLMAYADKLERAQAEEKRIDELAEVFANALHEHDNQWSPWRPAAEKWREELRAGVRAVLARLDQEKASGGDR